MEVEIKQSTGITVYTLSSKRPCIIYKILSLIGTIALLAILKPNLQQTALTLGAIVAIYTFLSRAKVEESIMIIYGIGIQIESKGFLKKLTDKTRFIPITAIRETIINEIFEGHKVVYVIQVILRDSNEIILGFNSMRPQIDLLSKVWNDIKRV